MRGSPPRCKGRYGQSSRNVRRVAMDAGNAQDEARKMRSTKPCGPDTPMLVSSLQHDCARRWLQSPVRRGEHGISRPTSRRERRSVSAALLLACASALSLHARLAGAASIRCSLRPHLLRGPRTSKTRAQTCRGNVEARHCEEPTGPREARPDDRLRDEAIQTWRPRSGLLRLRLAMTEAAAFRIPDC